MVCMYMCNLVYDNFVSMVTTKEDLLTKTVNTNGVFVNSDISLKHINVYGFDYDYTLVSYTTEVHRLIYDHAKNMLVDKFMVSNDYVLMSEVETDVCGACVFKFSVVMYCISE